LPQPTVFIIGAGGMVGAAAASALATRETVPDIALIDINQELAHGQAMDINHATAYSHGVRVRVGEYSDITGRDIVVITAGLAQRPNGQSRLSLLDANAGIMAGIIAQVAPQNPAFIVVVSNPVDVLTYLAWRWSGLPRERVFGTGTALDTARLRVELAQSLAVTPAQVDAYILGEHGDTSFAALSHATIGGLPLAQFPGYTPALTATINDDIRTAARRIIDAKKSTYFGIGRTVAQIVTALLHPTGTILPLSVVTTGEYDLRDVALGLPTLVNESGVRPLDHYPLNPAETQLLQHSAATLTGVIADHAARAKTAKSPHS
jgi:L-lactate dehydrogenase